MDFDLVAVKAVDYAPPDAGRQTIIEGIGRGVGRVAVHEFIHQMLGTAFADDYNDDGTYEYGRPDRPSRSRRSGRRCSGPNRPGGTASGGTRRVVPRPR